MTLTGNIGSKSGRYSQSGRDGRCEQRLGEERLAGNSLVRRRCTIVAMGRCHSIVGTLPRDGVVTDTDQRPRGLDALQLERRNGLGAEGKDNGSYYGRHGEK